MVKNLAVFVNLSALKVLAFNLKQKSTDFAYAPACLIAFGQRNHGRVCKLWTVWIVQICRLFTAGCASDNCHDPGVRARLLDDRRGNTVGMRFQVQIGLKCGTHAIVAVDQERSLVGMVVACQKEIDPGVVEQRQNFLANFDQKTIVVRLVFAVAVGGESD